MAIDFRVGQIANGSPRPVPRLVALTQSRLAAAKFAYTTRFVEQRVRQHPQGYFLDDGPSTQPTSGDVVVARVVQLGHHKRLESPASRRMLLFPGDEIVVAYGHRYAPDQFEAEVPTDLSQTNLVAAGGVAGHVTATREGLEPATVIEPVGLLTDSDGVVISLARSAPYSARPPLELRPTNGHRNGHPNGHRNGHPNGHLNRTPVIAAVGTSMNSGKSTALACLVRGLTRAGLRVAAGKATGTGAGGDPGMFRDAGASMVLDFTDFGYPSTYRLDHSEIRAVFATMIHELAASGADLVVVEIADGAYQLETARLLADPAFPQYVDHAMFTAVDAFSAVAGVQILQELGIEVAVATGRLTSSPLTAREAREVLDIPLLHTMDLCEPEVASALIPVAKYSR